MAVLSKLDDDVRVIQVAGQSIPVFGHADCANLRVAAGVPVGVTCVGCDRLGMDVSLLECHACQQWHDPQHSFPVCPECTKCPGCGSPVTWVCTRVVERGIPLYGRMFVFGDCGHVWNTIDAADRVVEIVTVYYPQRRHRHVVLSRDDDWADAECLVRITTRNHAPCHPPMGP